MAKSYQDIIDINLGLDISYVKTQIEKNQELAGKFIDEAEELESEIRRCRENLEHYLKPYDELITLLEELDKLNDTDNEVGTGISDLQEYVTVD